MKIKKTQIGIPAVLFLVIAALGCTIWYCYRPIAQPPTSPITYGIYNTGQGDIIIGGDTIRSSDTGWGGYSIRHTLYFNPHVAHPTLLELEDSAIRIGGASIYVPPSCTNLKYHKTVILDANRKHKPIAEAYGLEKDGVVDTAIIHQYTKGFVNIKTGHTKGIHKLPGQTTFYPDTSVLVSDLTWPEAAHDPQRQIYRYNRDKQDIELLDPVIDELEEYFKQHPLDLWGPKTFPYQTVDTNYYLTKDSTSVYSFKGHTLTIIFHGGVYAGWSMSNQVFDCSGPRKDSAWNEFINAVEKHVDSLIIKTK